MENLDKQNIQQPQQTAQATNTAPEINLEVATKFLESKNYIAISNTDLAKLKNGEAVENSILKDLLGNIETKKFGEATKQIKTRLEQEFNDLTGVPRIDGESYEKYTKRVISELKLSKSDAKELQEVLKSKDSEIEKTKSELTKLQTSLKRKDFESDFSKEFDAKVKKFGEIDPRLAVRLRNEIADKIFAERKETEDGVQYRYNNKLFNEKNQMYTIDTLIDTYMVENGFAEQTTEPAKKKGDANGFQTVVDKDNIPGETLQQKSLRLAQEQLKQTSGYAVQVLAKEIYAKIKNTK